MADWPMQNYLDVSRMGMVEALIARTAPVFVGMMRAEDGPTAHTMSRLAWETIDTTIDNCSFHSECDLPISFCVTSSEIVNAAAYHPDDWGLVVFTEGLIGRYIALVLSLLQAPDLERYLLSGTAAPEINMANLVPRREAIRSLVSDPLYLPQQPDMAVVDLLIRFGITFLTAHEVGHIVNGHLRSDLTSFMHVTEADLANLDDRSVSRTLEFDADFYATSICLKHFGEFAMKDGFQARYIGTPVSALRFHVTSAYLVFSLLDAFSDRSLEEADASGHPHPLVRLVSVLPSVASQVSTVSIDDLTEIVAGCSRAVELSLLQLAGGCLNEAVEIAVERSRAEYGEHARNWLEIRPRLEAARSGKAPLPQYTI